MRSTERGMVTEVNKVFSKALRPIFVIELGMVTEVKGVFENAELIYVTEFGMDTEVS